MDGHRRRVVIPAITGLAAAACLVLPPPASAVALDGCLTTRSASDFNGDGYDDAAVGDPYATVNGLAEAGAVTVLLGDADGRIGQGARQLITRASFGETPQAGDHFGFDVALADTGINSGCADLLVGSPGADVAGHRDAGTVHLIRDYPALEGTPDMDALLLTQADAGGSVEAGDEFGFSVAISGMTEGEFRRLVIGAPGESVGTLADAGAVNLVNVDTAPVPSVELRQGRAATTGGDKLPGTPQAGDRFGTSLALGSVDLDEQTTEERGHGLMIGAPGDRVSKHDGAGSVTVLSESLRSAALLSQDSAGVPGSAETGDRFGFSLALSPAAGNRPRTLAVGAPGEDVRGVPNAGLVTLFNNTGERFVPRSALSQATTGVPGTNEAGDQFGYALAFGHRTSTLLVGAPTEDVGSVVDAGAVQPVQVAGTGLPLSFPGTLTEDAPGTAGAVGAGHQFGLALGALSGQRENILTISSVYDARGSVYVLTDASGIEPRSWVAAAGAGRFGWSVTN